MGDEPLPPWPLAPGDAAGALRALSAGAPWRDAFEGLLLALAPLAAERLMQLTREGRAAFLPLLGEPPAGGARPTALLVGNALSGTAVALARAGYRLCVLDAAEERLALARWRDLGLSRGDALFVAAAGSGLPFASRAFDLVVQEGGERPTGFAHPLAELARVARGDVVLVADNRLAYKRSSGVRADFRVPRPWTWLRHALWSARGERTLAGYRAALAPLLGPADAFALYPHAADFSHVVALDAPLPRLTVGPKERANRVKLAADRAGLFPLLAPSFALLARAPHAAARVPRVAGWLRAIADATGEPLPAVENLVSTRGNTALLLTAVPGAPNDDRRGRWALHVALSPQQEVQARRHLAHLALLRERWPSVPVPEPLFEGTVDGVHVTAERRLRGLTAPQLTGDLAAAERTYRDVDAHLATLVETRVVLDRARFEQLVAAKFERVARRAGRPETSRAIERLLAELEPRLLGLELPLVFQHADLRAKHVQVERDGSVLGYLDWGSSEREDLPAFDLANLIVHDRKQQAGSSAAEAWAMLRTGALRPFEADALARHAERLRLPEAYRGALVEMYPVLVAAMAEKNWDYSRPRWVHRNFGL